MKNISLAINAILAIAVAILFYLHFSTPSTAISEEETTSIEEAPIEDLITESEE